MVGKHKKNTLYTFLNNNKSYPILAAIAAGLYPLLFYFSNNYTLVKTWGHLGYFLFSFLVVPMTGFVLAHKLFKLSTLKKWQNYVLPFLNYLVFLFLLGICHFGGIHKKASLLALIAAAIAAWLLHKQLKKVMVLQLLLAGIGMVMLAFTIFNEPNYSEEWLLQPDDIETVVFKKRPNVYYIQPDGYVNFSELKKGYYGIDKNDLERFLDSSGFKNYKNFRSNYSSTLASNSSMFMMKHHYYNDGPNASEGFNGREVIISKNTVLDIFKNNGYITHFITEMPYLLLNKPEMGYHKSNFALDEIPYISTGFQNKKDVTESFPKYFKEDENSPKFFFIEIFSPGHIKNAKIKSKGKVGEREAWIDRLENANTKLTDIIESIKKEDPEGVIVISADHGGYVGFDYANEIYVKTEDEERIRSIFSSILSIYWPKGEAPEYDGQLKTSVNIFRVLFSYLSEENKYLTNLSEDSSYIYITKKAPRGAYQYLDENGNMNFKRYNAN